MTNANVIPEASETAQVGLRARAIAAMERVEQQVVEQNAQRKRERLEYAYRQFDRLLSKVLGTPENSHQIRNPDESHLACDIDGLTFWYYFSPHYQSESWPYLQDECPDCGGTRTSGRLYGLECIGLWITGSRTSSDHRCPPRCSYCKGFIRDEDHDCLEKRCAIAEGQVFETRVETPESRLLDALRDWILTLTQGGDL